MIYTVTFNPSLDYIVSVKDFKLWNTNRTDTELMLPGGKGLNVSTVLKNLGMDSTALGFTAGFVGDEILRRIENIGFKSDFIKLENGCSRINLKLKNYDGTEINGQGPVIEHAHVEALMQKLDQLQEGDILILAGSIPSSMPASTYEDVLARLQDRKILTVVDATKNLLTNVLKYHPFLIKPNNHELGELFCLEFNTHEEVIPYAKELQKQGARNVLVSMGGKGAALVAENGEVYTSDAVKGRLVNAVGAGDSMVAGFLTGWLEQHDYAHAFRMALAAGSASAFSELLATKDEIMEIYDQLQV